MIPDGWAEPPEEVTSMARRLFEMFTALQAAGFTEEQAIGVLGQILFVTTTTAGGQ